MYITLIFMYRQLIIASDRKFHFVIFLTIFHSNGMKLNIYYTLRLQVKKQWYLLGDQLSSIILWWSHLRCHMGDKYRKQMGKKHYVWRHWFLSIYSHGFMFNQIPANTYTEIAALCYQPRILRGVVVLKVHLEPKGDKRHQCNMVKK